MTQVDLATESGLSIATIKALEGGKSEPRTESLLRLAEALGVSAGYLATGDAEGEPEGTALSPRARAMSASFLSLRRMSQSQLEAAEEMLRVMADMPEEDFQNPKR